jgi:predicted RNase H-like HicB family nuclease
MQVVALIHQENGIYGVSFPDFPGCVTGAEDIDTAMRKAAEVLAFHAEGLADDGPLPEVRTLAQLQKDRDFRSDAKSAAVAFIPYMPPSRALRINITMDESLVSRIDRAAADLGETRSGFLAGAARKRLSETI